jgi:uncharacterized protein YegJ (DUF2314 family)
MKYVLSIFGVVFLFAVVRLLRALGNVHACARTGRVDRLRQLLAKDPDLINAQTDEGETPVHQAAKYGQLETLRFLLERGGAVNAKSKQGVTPLHLAAGFGELKTVKFLLEKGAEVDPKEETGMTPIMAAQAQNHQEIVEVLKKSGANADAIPPIADFGGGHLMAPIANDDPLMVLANKKARETLPTLRDLFKEHPHDTMVKFPFVTDSGQTEHLWAELIALRSDAFKARVKTLPVTHAGKFQKIQERPLDDLEDWQVELRDGRIRGGYGFQVVFYRTKEKLGQLPPAAAAHEGRFVDHDISALLREAETVA